MASTLVAEGLIDDIKDWFSGQPVPCVQRLVAEGERVVRRKPCAQAASVLCTSGRGEVVRVPAALIRPGQVQLSFQHVRSHVVKLVDRIAAGNFDVEIPTADSFPGIVGPEGGSVILRDRNHHFAAFLALVGWLSREAAAGAGVPPAFEPLANALDSVQGPTVPVSIQLNHSRMRRPLFADVVRPHLFFDRVDGTLADEVPDRFSELEENPVRELVAKARAKVRPRGDGTLDLSVKRLAVWVKGPDAPAFVEFHVAKIVREALNSAGRPYDGLRSVTPLDEEIMRDALLRAEADPRHPSRHVLDRIVVVPRDLRDRLQLRAALRLDPDTHAVRIER